MKTRTIACSIVALSFAVAPAAFAQKLPAIKASAGNSVPACVTPGRLAAFLKSRNAGLDDRFATVSTEYMRHGEALAIRWDYAFFQMMLETGNLTFRRGNGREGSVKPSQNNFAGLGATGKGEPGESFPTVSAGVRAHLEHLLIYAGERVENPVAERTRKVQEWDILTSWQKSLKGSVTYSDLLGKWVVGDKRYAREIADIAESFMDDHCGKPDPSPDLVAAARAKTPAAVVAAAAPAGRKSRVGSDDEGAGERVSGAELARRAVEEARAEGNGARSALGAGGIAATQPMTILNAPKEPPVTEPAERSDDRAEAKVAAAAPPALGKSGDGRKMPVKPASAAAAAKAVAPPAKPGSAETAAEAPGAAGCKVFQASYGGLKAIIIKAQTPEGPSYTVLDVNEGNEKREAEAYIAAYAKGGEAVGEFPTQTQALDKAFELCPEG